MQSVKSTAESPISTTAGNLHGMADRKEVLVRIAVVGAGAIGAYWGEALHRGGAEVHLIARNQHFEAKRSHGVKVISPRGDFEAQPHATDDPAEVGPVDYVFLGLKAHSGCSPGCPAALRT